MRRSRLCFWLPLLLAPAGSIECWHGEYTYDRCCTAYLPDFPSGDPRCWSGEWTFKRCCRKGAVETPAGQGRGRRAEPVLSGAQLAEAVAYDAEVDKYWHIRNTADIVIDREREKALEVRLRAELDALDGGRGPQDCVALFEAEAEGALLELAERRGSWRRLLQQRARPERPEAPAGSCPRLPFLQPVPKREDLGKLLRRLSLQGVGVEVGVADGLFTRALLREWRLPALFVQVDLWGDEQDWNRYKDSSNMKQPRQDAYRASACRIGRAMVQQGFAGAVAQCRGDSVRCAEHFADGSLDFIYLDARHDRLSVLQELRTYWPKLRRGGVLAGHDYTQQEDPDASQDPLSTGQDWSLYANGSREALGRAVRGAVDDFFSGGPEAPSELRRCPRQLLVTYRELKFNTWIVVK